MSTTNKYNNIFLIAATEREQAGFLNLHFGNLKLMDRRDKGDLIIFVYGDEKIKKAEIKDHHEERGIQDLIIPYKENYITLSEKTVKGIQYCVSNFNFNYVYKADITKVIEIDYLDLDKEEREDFIGISAIRPRKDKWGGFTHLGIIRECTPCARRVFRRWASKRDLKVHDWLYDDAVYYSGWKPYGLSRKFAEIVARYGDAYSKLYIESFAGCEDHMIGKIWKDFSISHELTMR